MNPEEGELRPQLLDRFGLSVSLANPTDADLRMAIVRARLNFDEAPHELAEQHAGEQARLVAAVATARAALPALAWSDAVLHHAATCALASGVDGLRADLVMLRAARALAAFDGRDEITTQDVDAVAELALAHRRGDNVQPPATSAASPPPPPPPPPKPRAPPEKKADRPQAEHSAPDQQPDRTSPDSPANGSPMGDWGALLPRPETTTRVPSVGGWISKKA
jgi:magnesium chelatase subunit I